MKSKQFLSEIRESAGLRRAVLKKIELSKDMVTFFLVTDLTYSAQDIDYAREVAGRYVPAGCRAEVSVMKSVPSAEGIRRATLDLLATKFPSVAAFVSPEDVKAETGEGGGRFYIYADEEAQKSLSTDGALDAISEELGRRFCGVWMGEFRFRTVDRGELEIDAPPPPEPLPAPRFFEISGYDGIDGAAPEHAVYIADLDREMENVTVCGRISYLEERLTKKGKPYFSFTISDGTGVLRCSYFSKQATIEKIRDLRTGDSVCLTGNNELFNGSLSFSARKADRGSVPENFVPEKRPSKPVPQQYRAVFPSPAADLVQGDLFGTERLPAALTEREFVVFDLETTGLGESGGTMDRIIEVGAVRIRGGQIVEKFSSFVACPVRLPEKIIELTGITDDMLVGAPEIKDVIADFYKFCSGCCLVGHNVQFDYKFIRYYGEKEGYIFDARQYDTFAMAQELLRLSNYKLNTVADYFGFTFNHHRAFDDAFVTAKIFIELVRMKKGLPY